ncbi:hypothetical protein [Aureimonas psammosilenae]|uniref:hypothetical protein n=1 Tax=Aureimonas psammosilenae TaxID=2495496 RepID=UPI001260E3A8|nr:hypothetical protein [Aureimonas psammosilenae]
MDDPVRDLERRGQTETVVSINIDTSPVRSVSAFRATTTEALTVPGTEPLDSTPRNSIRNSTAISFELRNRRNAAIPIWFQGKTKISESHAQVAQAVSRALCACARNGLDCCSATTLLFSDVRRGLRR